MKDLLSKKKSQAEQLRQRFEATKVELLHPAGTPEARRAARAAAVADALRMACPSSLGQPPDAEVSSSYASTSSGASDESEMSPDPQQHEAASGSRSRRAAVQAASLDAMLQDVLSRSKAMHERVSGMRSPLPAVGADCAALGVLCPPALIALLVCDI